MNRILILTFTSIILFSCNKSIENQIIGTWTSGPATIIFNADKTVKIKSKQIDEDGFWEFNEETMELCSTSSENYDKDKEGCVIIERIDKNELCVHHPENPFNNSSQNLTCWKRE